MVARSDSSSRVRAPAEAHALGSPAPGGAGVEVHRGRGDALLEQLLAGPLERGVARAALPHGPGRGHAEALLVQAPVGVAEGVTGRLVGARETGDDHHA